MLYYNKYLGFNMRTCYYKFSDFQKYIDNNFKRTRKVKNK